jgi:hypothetical protein
MWSFRKGSTRFQGVGRTAVLLALWAGLTAGQLAAGSISYQVTSLGSNAFRYDYTVNFNLLEDQEIDIKFDPALYTGLNNGIAGSDFRLVVLQPGNPAGAFGDYSILALLDNPSLSGPFSIQFTYLGSGRPGGQSYLVHQFDPSGQNIIGTLDSGTTATASPEPASWMLGGIGLIISGILRRASNRS